VSADDGVSIQIRENDSHRYYFVMNFTEEQRGVTLSLEMEDIITNKTIQAGKSVLEPYGILILKYNG